MVTQRSPKSQSGVRFSPLLPMLILSSMSTIKSFVERNYELLHKVEIRDGASVRIFKAKPIRPIPADIVDDLIKNEVDYFSYQPYRSFRNRYTLGNPDYGRWDAAIVRHWHGHSLDVYVCSIIIRPFKEQSRLRYEKECFPSAPLARLKQMYDSRINDENID